VEVYVNNILADVKRSGISTTYSKCYFPSI